MVFIIHNYNRRPSTIRPVRMKEKLYWLADSEKTRSRDRKNRMIEAESSITLAKDSADILLLRTATCCKFADRGEHASNIGPVQGPDPCYVYRWSEAFRDSAFRCGILLTSAAFRRTGGALFARPRRKHRCSRSCSRLYHGRGTRPR
jgi:hypothetical protein